MSLRYLGTVRSCLAKYAPNVDEALVSPLVRGCEVFVNPRLRTSLGMARWRPAQDLAWIELNPALFSGNADADALIVNTLTHEIAHLIAGPGEGHSPRWRRIHRKLGGTGERTATNEVALALGLDRKRAKRRHVATCSRCNLALMRTRRLAARRIYQHRGCGGWFIAE